MGTPSSAPIRNNDSPTWGPQCLPVQYTVSLLWSHFFLYSNYSQCLTKKSMPRVEKTPKSSIRMMPKRICPKKLTALERTAAEGEALQKEMGYKEDGEDQGRRRTRSGGRGLPVSSPPAKKEKKAAATTGTGRRGRPPKKVANKISKDAEEPEKKEKESERTESPEAV